MDAPKCNQCGKREWRHVCAGLPDAIKNTSRGGSRVLKAEAERPDATRIEATANPDPTTPPGKELGADPEKRTKAEKVRPGKPETAQKFDRVAYQREYMREYMKKRRAAVTNKE